MSGQEWRRKAACIGVPDDVMFPKGEFGPGARHRVDIFGPAKALCRSRGRLRSPEYLEELTVRPNNGRGPGRRRLQSPRRATNRPWRSRLMPVSHSRLCAYDGCLRKHRARGFCDAHYTRYTRHGDPSYDGRRPPLIDRFNKRIIPQPDGCWLWTGGRATNGYGRMALTERDSVYAHRWSYEHFVGPLIAGMTIDHLCGTKLCVNPEHLEQVTNVENVRRAVRPGYGPLAPTQCQRGHSWADEQSFYVAHRADGRATRRCRQCQNDKAKQSRTSCHLCGRNLRRDSLTRHRALVHGVALVSQRDDGGDL